MNQLTLYYHPELDLKALDQNINEIIFTPKEYSKFGTQSIQEMSTSFQETKSLNRRCILEWDLMLSEDDFEQLDQGALRAHLDNFDSVRVFDPGLCQFMFENFPQMKIQLSFEFNNHNLVGLKAWEKLSQGRIERFILSHQTTKEMIGHYKRRLQTPLEILGFGRILLFQSPRKLLSPFFESSDTQIEVLADSEESVHKNFPTLENQYGTFMFYPKDLCILDEMDDFEVDYIRIDNRFDLVGKESLIQRLINNGLHIKNEFPRTFVKGFFLANKSDVLFSRLKNQSLEKISGNVIAEVVDAQKGKYCVLKSKRELITGQEYGLVSPEGNEVQFKLKEQTKLNLGSENIYTMTSHIPKAVSSSLIYLSIN